MDTTTNGEAAPTDNEDPVARLLEQIGAWMEKKDNRPRQLRLECKPIMTKHGVGRAFQLHEETILAQLTESPEPSPIITR